MRGKQDKAYTLTKRKSEEARIAEVIVEVIRVMGTMSLSVAAD